MFTRIQSGGSISHSRLPKEIMIEDSLFKLTLSFFLRESPSDINPEILQNSPQ
jgi:hypothetical protein